MEASDVIDRMRDTFTLQRVFGAPIQQGDVTLIPAAWVSGGGGGGGGEAPAEHLEGKEAGTGRGSGGGLGLRIRPAGAFILRDGKAHWMPVVDVNRVILGMQVLMGLFLVLIGRKLVAPKRQAPPVGWWLMRRGGKGRFKP
jgi:uncharacterized spore protein YtfJ